MWYNKSKNAPYSIQHSLKIRFLRCDSLFIELVQTEHPQSPKASYFSPFSNFIKPTTFCFAFLVKSSVKIQWPKYHSIDKPSKTNSHYIAIVPNSLGKFCHQVQIFITLYKGFDNIKDKQVKVFSISCYFTCISLYEFK